MEFASNAKGNAALTTGIIGTAGVGLGLLGSLLGGHAAGYAAGTNNGSSNDQPVNRYELALQQEIAAKDAKIGLLESNVYTDAKIKATADQIYADIRGIGARLDATDARLCKNERESAVYAATANGAISCMQQQINALLGMTKLVVPNTSVCPGWGDVTVEVTPTTTTTATT